MSTTLEVVLLPFLLADTNPVHEGQRSIARWKWRLESVQEVCYLAKRRDMSLIIAVCMKAKAVVEKRSKSFDRRRLMPSHAIVRSTIQRFGRTSNPA